MRAQRATKSVGSRTRPPLAQMSWTDINSFLRDASEAEALAMVEEERRSGKYRPVVLHRIVCRYTKMLVDRVRREKLTPAR